MFESGEVLAIDHDERFYWSKSKKNNMIKIHVQEINKMGMQSTIYGYIEEAWPGAAGENKELLYSNASTISSLNEKVISSLPNEDEWPPLPNSIFGWAPTERPMVNYRNRPIHFAASLKEMDWALRDWLDKFESLLKRMYWENVTVHYEGAYIGEHTFRWNPKEEWGLGLTKGILTPVDDWDFESTLSKAKLDELRE